MRTILLADDEKPLRVLVRTTLDSPEFRILEACDGQETIDTARRERPDLVVLDWMMPLLSGIEVATRLRQDPSTAGIPIIMLTAKGQQSDMQLAKSAGITTYLAKPFSPLELLDRVSAILGAGQRT